MIEAAPLRRSRVGAAVTAVAVGLGCAGAGVAAPFAGPIGASTPEAVRARGSDAIAGLGDWALSNGVLCAAVLGADSEGQLVAGGGSLVDLAHCGRADDQFIGVEPLYDFSQREYLRVRAVRAESDARGARVIASAAEDGLELETAFALDVDDPRRLLISTRLQRRSAGPRLRGFQELLLHSRNALRSFTRQRSGPSEGFAHVDLDHSGVWEIAAAIRAVDSTTLIGSDAQGPPIAYRYRVTRLERVGSDGRREPLSHLGLGLESVSLLHVFPEPLWIDGDALGVAQAIQALWMDLPVGSRIEFEREIRVASRSDAAVFEDAADARRVSGSLGDPDARLHVDRAGPEGAFAPYTFAKPEPSGAFALRLPPGRYRVRAVGSAGGAGRLGERTFEVAADDVELAPLGPAPGATLRLPHGAPMRLAFRGIDGTADPRFGDDHTKATVGGQPGPNSTASSDVHLAGVEGDPERVRLPPGRYRVRATRGPEFSVGTAEIALRAGETAALEIATPLRELETPGWIAADFHVHAAPSFDSTLPRRRRIASFVAEGGEVIVSTDHDVVGSYAPLIRAMGLERALRSVDGVEVTSISKTARTPYSGGHANLYPVPLRPERTRGGAPPGEGMRLRDLVASARALPVPAIVQLNHPRDLVGDDHGGAYFEHLAVVGEPFDPALPLDAAPNRALIERDPATGLRDLDIDAIELLNGSKLAEYATVQRDWHALLRQGVRLTAMANSDSHTFDRIVAMPRTYVSVADDRVAAVTTGALISAVRRGACFGTTGPLLDVALEDARPGDTFAGARGTLHVAVRSASWIPVSRATISVDGEARAEIETDGSEPIEVALSFDADAYVTVEVRGEPSPAYADLLPGMRPLAFSNPIWVDADADGQWRAPGLPH